VSPSEFAFLALGLILGVATGAAFVVVFRSRPPAREIRVTVARDAVPVRSSTLSASAFGGSANAVARGGPADRRLADRGTPAPPESDGVSVPALAPAAAAGAIASPEATAPAAAAPSAGGSAGVDAGRTLVRDGVEYVGLPVGPVGAPGAGGPTGRIPLPRNRAAAIVAERIAAANAARLADATARRPSTLLEILRGDEAALIEVADAASHRDREAGREWERRMSALVSALSARALELGVIDVPLGHPFWDDFTIEECRRLAATLAAEGFRFDGRAGWQGARIPTVAQLTAAVAACGIQPTRVRSWPARSEVVDLFRGARIAWGDLLATQPDLTAAGLRALLGPLGSGMDPTWAAWDEIRPHLLAEVRATVR
jgi:hypothetical protein